MHNLTICDVAHIEHLYSKVQIHDYSRHRNGAQRLPVVRVVVEEDKCASLLPEFAPMFDIGLVKDSKLPLTNKDHSATPTSSEGVNYQLQD